MESMMYSQEHEDTNPSSCICGKRRSPSSSVQPIPKREKPPLYPSSVGLTKLPLSPTAFSSPLRRCTSDPVPLMTEDHLHADVATPEKKKLCRSVSAPEKDLIDESPNSKRLKRMKEQMREISKWCDQVIAEGDEEGKDEGEDHLVGAEVVDKEALKGYENKVCESAEEAVSVEKNGDCLIIHMKCPCSKGYQFLLSGNNCYYKIM